MIKCIPIFKQNCNIFNENTRRKIVELAIQEENDYSIIGYLNSEEQYKFIMEKRDIVALENILNYINIDVAERLVKEKFGINYNFFSNGYHSYDFIKHCNEKVQLALLLNDKDLIEYADINVQAQYVKEHEEAIDLVNNQAKKIFLENNIEFLNQHMEYVKDTSKTTQLLFARQKKENLKYINEKYQIELIERHPQAFEYADEKTKNLLFNNVKYIKIINNLLNSNIKYFKYIGYEKSEDITKEYLQNLQENIKNIETDKLVDLFVKSGILSAKGNLRSSPSSYYTGLGEREYSEGLDIYSHGQLKVIQELNIKQMSELIKIDANYIMPYITGEEDTNSIEKENVGSLKEKCKQVFIELYGEDKFNEIEECINNIFDAQLDYQENSKDTNLDGKKFSEYKIPLESLKLLFNEKIIANNSPELIRDYYSKLFTETEGKDEFRQIIENTYGEKAIEILDSRNQLDVYGINSLEVFDERILDNFSEEFVHDLISYNIRDFSSFLHIVKSDKELESFKYYYEILSNVLGKNVMTMQKAISEFYYNEELINNIKNKELTEKEQINLLSVLCGGKNQLDINTIEQLENFDEIANADLQAKIDAGMKVKDLIFSNIFGISEEDALEINDLFGLDIVNEIMDEEEIEMIKCLKMILEEGNENILKQLAKKLTEQTGIRNPIALHSAISKIKKHNTEILKAKMLTKDKLDQICIDKQDSGEIRKENIDGIEIYYFEGLRLEEIGLGFIGHATDNSNGRDFMEYEGQAAMSTVSARLYLNIDKSAILCTGGAYMPSLIFTELEEEDLVAFYEIDANVLHAPKLVKSKGLCGARIGESHEFDNGTNEFAFYRRTRNHDKRSKQNPDGRIKPSYILVINDKKNEGSIEDIPKDKLEYAKKYNIPIIVYKKQRYIERRNEEIENDR